MITWRNRNAARTLAARRFRLEPLEGRLLLAGDPIISELAANNDGSLLDEDGETSDWVELYNRGDDAVDLDGWYLTDDALDLAKWQLPPTTLPADAYLIVFASSKDRTGAELHTNFRLSADGEFLALVRPDGQTIASGFGPAFPEQVEGFTYGYHQQTVTTPLVSEGDQGRILVPTVANDGDQLAQSWTGGQPFDDSSWTVGPTGFGFDASAGGGPTLPEQAVAYQIAGGTAGTQDYGGSLGMDFVVDLPVTILELGAFDDSSNGINRTITVELWSRSDAGTPDTPGDDTGIAVLASETFTNADPGTLVGGSRFKTLAAPLELAPGAYTISAHGYGTGELNGNTGGAGSFGTLAATPAVRFVGTSRFAPGGATGFPGQADGGPANRYGAGTFKFQYDPTPTLQLLNASFETPSQLDHLPANGNPFTNDMAGWTQSGATNGAGTYNPSDNQFTGAGDQTPDLDTTIPDGRNVAFINSGYFYQNVAETLRANRTYTLSTHVAGRLDNGGTSYEVRLLAGGEVVGSAAGVAEPNQWDEVTIDVTATGDHPQLGEQLRVEIENTGGAQLNVDHVDLSQQTLFTTDVQEAMHEVNASAFVRIPFTVGATDAFDRLRLRVRYDDGFVAYLNGVQVAAANAPATPAWNATALTARPDEDVLPFATFDVSSHLGALTPHGENVLALHGLNVALNDDDFAVGAELEAVESLDVVAQFYPEPTPGGPGEVGFPGFVGDTCFSVDRGVYDAPFDVEITTDTAGATIVFTTDGSEPTLVHGTQVAAPDPLTPPTAVVAIAGTTTLRAAAFKDDFWPTNVDTHTYIFLDDVIHQPSAPAGFPLDWGGAGGDYAMDPTVAVNDPSYAPQMEGSLLSLPIMSLVTDVDHLFDPAGGIYYHSTARGRGWERPASIEYFDPNDPSAEFQVDAGLRIHGGASRVDSESMKKSFRLYFRDEYGPTRLNYPLFPDSPVDEFDKLVLRANFGDAWTVPREHPLDSSYVRDLWTRRTALEMGQPAPEGNNVHLYVNGLYWGIYNPTERTDEDYAESHFGFNEGGWDVVKPGEVLSGDWTAWNAMFAIANAGLASDEQYAAIQEYLDVENLVDYMILNIYAYNQDWFGGSKNMYAIRPRREGGQFIFVPWDSEHIFSIIGISRPLNTDISNAYNPDRSPARLYNQLRANEEFRLLFADRLHRFLFNDGPLTDQAVADRWLALAAEVELAVIAESARWGDSRAPYSSPLIPEPSPLWQSPLTQAHLLAEQNRLLTEVFPGRTQTVLDQFNAINLYPDLAAPEFNQHGGEVPFGFPLSMTAAEGTIYYTLDGADPRTPGEAQQTTLLASGAAVEALVPTAAGQLVDGEDDAWFEPAFDTTGWIAGTGGVGYDLDGTYDPLIGVDVEASMNATNDTVLVRVPFDVADQQTLDALDTLTLRMKYDDGFVAYLNGTEVLRVNAPATLDWDSAAPASHADTLAQVFEDFDVSAYLPLLHPGENLLAVHGLNTDVNGPLVSTDMLVLPELLGSNTVAAMLSPSAVEFTDPTPLTQSGTIRARALLGGQWSALLEATFVAGPPTLAVSEVMYHPPPPTQAEIDAGLLDAELFEFIELVNTGQHTVSLSGVRLIDGVTFDFGDGTIAELAPSERVLVVGNQAAFEQRYGTGLPVAGAFETGRLNNGGETIELVDALDRVIQRFRYNDGNTWPQTADGGGSSLEVVNMASDYDEPTTWYDSPQWGGSPGVAASAAVIARHVFYDGSAYDADSDDDAIAPNKIALRPGQTATTANFTNFDQGVNGVIVDVAWPDDASQLTDTDFTLLVGNDNDLSSWTAPATPDVDVVEGAGRGGSDRVYLSWPGAGPTNTWLQVTTLADSLHTGLTADDVFYFGNAVGETGNSSVNALVTAADLIAIRNHPRGAGNRADVVDPHDVNRDRHVNATDALLARNHATGPFDGLRLISPPLPNPAPAEAEGESVFHLAQLDGTTVTHPIRTASGTVVERIDLAIADHARRRHVSSHLVREQGTSALHRLHLPAYSIEGHARALGRQSIETITKHEFAGLDDTLANLVSVDWR